MRRQIPIQIQSKIDQELQSGEVIQWMDMPIPRFFTPSTIGIVLFAIPWTAFALFWTYGAAGFKMPNFNGVQSFFPLFGVPFILIGLGMFSTPFWSYRRALKTAYVLTNQRAILFIGGKSTMIRSFAPDQLRETYRREKSDGTGDVIFSTRNWRDFEGDRQREEFGFLQIHNPREVELLIKKLAEKKDFLGKHERERGVVA